MASGVTQCRMWALAQSIEDSYCDLGVLEGIFLAGSEDVEPSPDLQGANRLGQRCSPTLVVDTRVSMVSRFPLRRGVTMTKELDFETLSQAVSGGGVAFRCCVKLQPAGGQGTKVFPPTYAGAVYATEKRRLPDHAEPVECVLLDSVQSQANRMEEALQQAVDAGRPKSKFRSWKSTLRRTFPASHRRKICGSLIRSAK